MKIALSNRSNHDYGKQIEILTKENNIRENMNYCILLKNFFGKLWYYVLIDQPWDDRKSLLEMKIASMEGITPAHPNIKITDSLTNFIREVTNHFKF